MSLVANARFATLLAIALALLLSGVAAGAAGQALIIGAANQAGVSNTSLDTTSSGFAWQMYQHGTGVGVFGISDNGVALAGLANNGNQYALSVTNAGTAGTGAAIIADGRANTAADFRVNSNSIPPLKVNSTGKVTNLNADLLDGLNSTAFVQPRWAVVNSDGTLRRGTAGVTSSKSTTGAYRVNFGVDITGCAWTSTLDARAGVVGARGEISVQQGWHFQFFSLVIEPTVVLVFTLDSAGTYVDQNFHVVATC